MKRKQIAIIAGLLTLAAIAVVAFILSGDNVAVLQPKGIVADKERDLLITATLLSLIVVLPVFFLTFFIAWKYRASNKKAKYMPDWDGSRKLEAIWWGVPLALIIILSVIIYKSSHDLDPFKPLASDQPALKVQVIALQWKWLFIYPEHGIASVNFLQIPKDRPVSFDITSDAPMNSFWIPSLGGQVYAMSGMSTKLHLMANETGDYRGSSANISGEGFEGMKFIARASSQADFEAWTLEAQRSTKYLTKDEYHHLHAPSKNVQPINYVLAEPDLYNQVIMSFLGREHTKQKNTGH